MAEQSFQSHAKRLPSFHFFVLPVLLINFGFQIYWCVRAAFTIYGVLSVLVAAALFVGMVMGRMMAVKEQDRGIRIEERIRFERVLPAGMHARIGEVTIGPICALRVARKRE